MKTLLATLLLAAGLVTVPFRATGFTEKEKEYIDLARYIAPNFTETQTDADVLNINKSSCDSIQALKEQGMAEVIKSWRDIQRHRLKSKPQSEFSMILNREVAALYLLSGHLMCPYN